MVSITARLETKDFKHKNEVELAANNMTIMRFHLISSFAKMHIHVYLFLDRNLPDENVC